MNKFLRLLVVLVICVAAIGFYRGWFTMSSRSPDAGSNAVDINLKVDPDKMEADAETVKDKAVELTGQAKERANELVDQTSESK